MQFEHLDLIGRLMIFASKKDGRQEQNKFVGVHAFRRNVVPLSLGQSTVKALFQIAPDETSAWTWLFIITLQCDILALVWLFGPVNVTF